MSEKVFTYVINPLTYIYIQKYSLNLKRTALPHQLKTLEEFELCEIYCGPKKGRRMLYHLQKKKKKKEELKDISLEALSHCNAADLIGKILLSHTCVSGVFAFKKPLKS